ncbi:SIS domain-containing protein [Pelagibacterales bacterium SAG-MED15]|nr:SIS domain-containing protein [Pelagibacterales bacterium SAG-MED24]MBD1153788.1 SIS domain-containing protein [Pelagibacterales bacterium SAG-MED23]MBD1159635.1 SIS domain-containing protein [Pelagibacterales bacterium SAG-MED19]MBD1161896.1 SIS domain-containing protein [Pelagibacterales bacterium SAG-MED15]
MKAIKDNLREHLNTINIVERSLVEKISEASKIISKSLKMGGTIFWCGNGGSAADSMHLSAELIGRFKKNRIPLKSISLSSNPSTITCISNDFGYESLFSRQIQALGKKDDVLIVISTSGNSKNIIKAINQAKINKLKVVSFLGNKGGKCKGKGYLDLIVNSNSTARIQESHIMIGHIICELIEKELKI